MTMQIYFFLVQKFFNKYVQIFCAAIVAMNMQKNTRCDACDITYQSTNSLKRHNNQIHSDHPDYQCPKCSKRLGGKLELEKHMQTHDTDNFFKSVCGFCGKKSKTEESHSNHIKYNHTKERVHKCNICPKVFPYKSALESHKSGHENETKPLEKYLDCDQCPQKLKTKLTLGIHKMMHAGITPYGCDFCEKKFRQSAHKRTHQRNVHMASVDKPFKCNQCSKSYSSSSERNRHQKYHLKRSVQCSICEMHFKNIKTHTKNIHKEKEKYVGCRTCADVFASQGLRKQHEKTHIQEKELQCPSCNYKTSLPTNLKIHTRIHTQERPFKCKQCDFSSATGGTMTGHVQRIHKKNKWVRCQICLKEIKQQTYKRHMSDHLDEPKFKCYVCDKRFKRSSHKYLHEATHENPTSSSAKRVRKEVQCTDCGNILKGSLSLKSHKLSQHTTERPHKCSICPKLFPSENTRNMHERIHTEQILHCTVCNKQCPNRPSLVRHKRSVHKAVMFDCQICDQKFRTASGFQKHNLQHKENETEKDECDLCGDQFTDERSLKLHKDAQHKQITHACPKCGFKLKYKMQLKLHLETHNESGNKNVECDLCDDKFSTRAYMKLHRKSRHMGYTHNCIQCDVKFLWKVSLVSHMKANHGGTVQKTI